MSLKRVSRIAGATARPLHQPSVAVVARGLAIAVAAAVLSACTAGPEYVRPTLPVPATFAHADSTQELSTDGGVADATKALDHEASFWLGFGDALLARLVNDALRANHDLRIGLAQFDRANALLRGARFDQIPTVTAHAQGADARASADQAPGVDRDARDVESYSAGLSASWEIDLFGRVRRGVESQRAQARATAADLQAMQIAVVGEVAQAYVGLRGRQERLRVARENAANQRETLRLVDARLEAGRGTEFDTSRARAQLEATLARVPALEAEIAVDMHRLAVLTGRTPGALIAELKVPAPLPALPARLDPGTPGELLRRRPDVVAAEQRLHAATARIGVATADLFPRFTLSGLLGSQAIDAGALFERASETRSVALGIDWSFLDIGRVRARIAAADAEGEGELARYQQSVLMALEDAENALVRYGHARAEDLHLEHAAIDSASAAALARVRFDAGAADLFEVLDAERTRLQAQDALAAARTRTMSGAVALYRALAGGWLVGLPGRMPLEEEPA